MTGQTAQAASHCRVPNDTFKFGLTGDTLDRIDRGLVLWGCAIGPKDSEVAIARQRRLAPFAQPRFHLSTGRRQMRHYFRHGRIAQNAFAGQEQIEARDLVENRWLARSYLREAP
jgi:hypothetical protein